MLNTNNFVSRLSDADFLEFANEYFDEKYKYVTVYRMGDKSVQQVVFHNSKKFKSFGKDTKRVFFHEFDYIENMIDFDQIFWSRNVFWRSFMTKKFGMEYVDAFRKFMEGYFKNEESKLVEKKKDYMREINRLMGNSQNE